MGMEQVVTFEKGRTPSWPVVSEFLARHGFPIQMRMIDGELAFPDEQPPDTWRELRLGTASGMVTVRREADRLLLVVWGNADAGLTQAWNALVWAFAAAGMGMIQTSEGSATADSYRHTANLPEALRTGGLP